MAEIMRKILGCLQGGNRMAEGQTDKIIEALKDLNGRYDRVEQTLKGRSTKLRKTLKRYNESIAFTQGRLDKYTDILAELLSSEEGIVKGYTRNNLDDEVKYARGLLRGSKQKREKTLDDLAYLTDKVSAFIDRRNELNRKLAKLKGEE